MRSTRDKVCGAALVPAAAVLLRLGDHRHRLHHDGNRGDGSTAFSLLLPPLIGEFGWDRGRTAGAFSFGFLISALLSPVAGR
jgi:hypothetical protein